MKKTLIVISTLALFACGGTKTVATSQPTVETVETAEKVETVETLEALASHYTDATIDQLNSGKVLFEKTCDMCHGFKKSYAASGYMLDEVVPKMVVKANKKAGQTLISPEGGENILHYLKALNAK